MEFTEIDYEKLSATLVTALEKSHVERRENGESCSCGVSQPIHRRHHDFIDEVIKFFVRLNEMKWGVVRTIVIVTILAFLTVVFGIGFKAYMLKWLGI